MISGYGPAIDIDLDIENDLNIPDLDNPIDDIDLGNGQVVNRPSLAAATAEEEEEEEDQPDSAFTALCSAALGRSEEEVAHPRDCSKFLSCQPGGSSGVEVLVTVRDCGPGTVWDTQTNRCNHRSNVPRCQTGQQVQQEKLSKNVQFFVVGNPRCYQC